MSTTDVTVQDTKPTCLKASLDAYEAWVLAQVLAANGWHRRQSAAKLGISRATLHNKVKRLRVHRVVTELCPELLAKVSGVKLAEVLVEYECKLVLKALRDNAGRRTATARQLGISRVTLYNKMKRFGC